MKKIIAFLTAVFLMLSMIPVYAQEPECCSSNEDVTENSNCTEYDREVNNEVQEETVFDKEKIEEDTESSEQTNSIIEKENESGDKIEEIELEKNVFSDMEEVIIERGWYSICNYLDQSLCFDVSAMSENSGANVQIYKYNDSFAQKFFVTKKDNGWYIIQNVASKKNIGNNENIAENGSNVAQWDGKDIETQEFKFYRDSQGAVIIAVHSDQGLVCDITAGWLQNGSNVQLYSYNGTAAQQFVMKKCEFPGEEVNIEEAIYRIYPSYAAGLSLDVYGGSAQDGANVQLYSNNGTTAQEWKIIKQGEWYRILSEKSGKTLDVQWGASSAGANLQQWTLNSGNGQLFRFYQKGENEYCIISKIGNAVDCQWGELKCNTNVQMYDINGTKAQSWGLEKVLVSSKSERILDGGFYTFSPGSNLNAYMSVENASLEMQANISITETPIADEYVFKMEKQSDGWFMLKNLESGKYVDVENGSTAIGANVHQYDKNGSSAQKFKFYITDEGRYYIKSKLSTYLECSMDDRNIQMNDICGELNQQWELRKIVPEKSEVVIENGDYIIMSDLGNNLVLDIKNASKYSGGNVQVYTNNGSKAQNYQICRQIDGWYTITNIGSGLCLDVTGANNASGANLQQYINNKSDAQKFKFYDAGNGTVYIKSKLGTYVDVMYGMSQAGTNVQMYSFNGSNAQRWILKENSTLIKLEEIKKYITSPYIYGGTSPAGWDCSGFTQWALSYLGVSIPRLSYQQAAGGIRVDKNYMSLWKPGDILVYSSGGSVNHVALYLGDGMLMHALSSKWGTLIQGVTYYENWDKKNTLTDVRRYL